MEILVSHNPLLRQYLKQQANDDVYRLYGKTQERRGKAEERREGKNIYNDGYGYRFQKHNYLNRKELINCCLANTIT